MDPIEEKKTPNGGKDCDLCINDDDKIDVSVSPRRFSLPPPKDKKAKMEIKNKNSYPIYYKAGTSNMDAFTAHPNTGRIPPNSKVSVIVQFFNSARPVRRHEEVVVLTSLRPFDLLYEDNICPYCSEPLSFSKHHHGTKRIYSEDSTEGQQTFQFWESSAKQRGVLDKYGSRSSSEETFQRKFSIPKREQLLTTNYARNQTKDQGFKTRHSDEVLFDKKEHDVRKEMHKIGTEGLEEICLHAFVHRITSDKCGCNNCVELGIQTKGQTVTQPAFETERLGKETKIADTSKKIKESKSEEQAATEFQKETKEEKDLRATRKENGTKHKEKTAHIMARVVKSLESKESTGSETTMSSDFDDKMTTMRKLPKIISEEDFKKKVEKAKVKKLQKVKEEKDSESTTTLEATVSKEAPEKLPEKKVKRHEKWTLRAIDSKCSALLHLTWTTFFLLLLLILIVVSSIIFCCTKDVKSDGSTQSYPPTPCFRNLFG